MSLHCCISIVFCLFFRVFIAPTITLTSIKQRYPSAQQIYVRNLYIYFLYQDHPASLCYLFEARTKLYQTLSIISTGPITLYILWLGA
jgi:hypothetical protein